MKLADLRKFAIRKQTRIRFPLRNGMECVVNELGVAQVPALNRPADFNLEEELAAAETFALEPVPAAGARHLTQSSSIGRDQLAGLTQDGHAAAAPRDEHEEE
jgi:hypothetical protein